MFTLTTQEMNSLIRTYPKIPAFVSTKRSGTHLTIAAIEMYSGACIAPNVCFTTERPNMIGRLFDLDFAAVHTHHPQGCAARPNFEIPDDVIFQYRNPIDAAYSLYAMEGPKTESKSTLMTWANTWAIQYAASLRHFVIEKVPEKLTIIRYERLIHGQSEFHKILDHLGINWNLMRAEAVLRICNQYFIGKLFQSKLLPRYHQPNKGLTMDEFMELVGDSCEIMLESHLGMTIEEFERRYGSD